MITFIIIWWLILGLLAFRVIWVYEEVAIVNNYNYIGIALLCLIAGAVGPILLGYTLDSIPDKDYKFWK